MEGKQIDPAGAYQTLLLLWFALLASQFLFILLLFVLKHDLMRIDLSRPLLEESAIIVIGIAALSVLNLVLSFEQRKKLLEQAVSEQNVGHVLTALIIGGGLCESISLFGIVLAFVFDYPYFWLFFALGIFGTIFHFPRRKTFEAASYKNL